jgi:hypothetical protein
VQLPVRSAGQRKICNTRSAENQPGNEPIAAADKAAAASQRSRRELSRNLALCPVGAFYSAVCVRVLTFHKLRRTNVLPLTGMEGALMHASWES